MKNMNLQRHATQDGFVLIVSMMILLVLTLLGIMATRSTMTELTISGHDKVHKQTFSQADGGTELAQHLIYHNGICSSVSGGFTANTTYQDNVAAMINDTILVENLDFFNSLTDEDLYSTISDSNRTFSFYPTGNTDNGEPHTNFINTSSTVNNPGSALQMVSGYEGMAAGSVSGTSRRFTIASQHMGEVNSQSKIKVLWQLNNSVISSASIYDCEY